MSCFRQPDEGPKGHRARLDSNREQHAAGNEGLGHRPGRASMIAAFAAVAVAVIATGLVGKADQTA